MSDVTNHPTINNRSTYLFRDSVRQRIAEIRLDRYSPSRALMRVVYMDGNIDMMTSVSRPTEWVETDHFWKRYILLDTIPDSVRPD